MKAILIMCIAACVVMTACDESSVAVPPQKTQVIETQYLTQQTWIVKQSDPVYTVQPLDNAMQYTFKTDQSFSVLDSRFMFWYYGNWEFNSDTSAIVMHYNFSGPYPAAMSDSTDTLEILELTSNILKVQYNDPPSFLGIDNLPALELEPAEEEEVFFTIKGNLPNASSLPANARPIILWSGNKSTFELHGIGNINRATNSFEINLRGLRLGSVRARKPGVELSVGYILLTIEDDLLKKQEDSFELPIDTSKIIGGVSDKAVLMYKLALAGLDQNAVEGIPIKPNTGISWVDMIFSNELYPRGIRMVQDNGSNGLEMNPSSSVLSAGTLQMSVGSINDLNLPDWEW